MGYELVTGPPASGKKTYLTAKIRESLKNNKPEDLLVLTNSGSSARFFRDCIIENIDSYTELWSETVSSFCKKILREYYFLAGIKPAFKVITDFEKRLIVRNILKSTRLKFLSNSGSGEGLIREISNFIDIARKNPGWEKNIKNEAKYQDLRMLLGNYQNTLRKFNYLDFVDLAVFTRKLLKKENPGIINPPLLPPFSKGGRGGFKAFFVYEAEDMDPVMGDIIIEILSLVGQGIVSIEPSIGIYDFRGSLPYEMKEKLIKNFNFQIKEFKQEKTENKEFFLESQTRDEQARYAASHIASKIRSGTNPRDIAVISRSTGENLWVFTEALKHKGINHVLVGGIGFFRNPGIIELLSFLSCIHKKQDSDDTHVYRAIKILGILSENELDILRRKSFISGKPLKAVFGQDKRSKEFWNKIKEISAQARQVPADRFIYGLMEKYGFLKNSVFNESSAPVYSYFYDIVRNFSEHSRKSRAAPLKFDEFMENIFQVMSGYGKELDIPYMPDREAVRIMTVQRAKGELFKTVYIVDMTEDNFPRPFFENPLVSSHDFRALNLRPVPGVTQQYEFETRLFEVASTRATEETIYCWHKTEEDGSTVEISSFIKDKRAQSIKEEIMNCVVDENDLFLNLAEKFSKKDRQEIIKRINPRLSEKMRSIDNIIEFDEKSLKDKVACAPEVFSYTILEDFRECPQYFFLRHILKLKEPSTTAMMLGIAVHRILQNMHSANITEPQRVRKLIDEVWKQMDFGSGFEARNLYIIACTMISEYLKSLDDFEVESTEENFRVNYKGAEFTGRFDRVDRLGRDERLVDYKTSKRIPGTAGLLSSVERGDNFQIPLYRLARACRYFAIYRMREKHDKMLVAIDFEDRKAEKALSKAEHEIFAAIDEIRKGVFISGKNSKCRNCYFERICNK
jgi:superfamily I DNA/RNA helicase